jgi:allantoinase
VSDAAPFDRVIRGDIVLSDRVLRDGYVAIRGETIAAIGEGASPPAAAFSDFSGKYVLPGLVDGHMHTSSSRGWPGISGASMTAAAGGVTTCVDMPYDVPRPVTDASILAEKIAVVNATSHVDMALYGTITKEGGIDAIAGLAEAGVCSFKLSTYEYDPVRFPRIDHPTMVAAFREIAKTGLMVAIHNEDQEIVVRMTEEAKAAGNTSPIWHCRTRPPLCETMADLEIFEIGLETGAHVHIAHSSLARGFEIAEVFRKMGGKASGEACIQYLCMTEDDIIRLEGFGKCNPPFRTADEVSRMWDAFAAGKVAYVSTDHAPWPKDRKTYTGDIFTVGAGLTGMQSFAPLMFTLLTERSLPVTLMGEVLRRATGEVPRAVPEEGRDPHRRRCRFRGDGDRRLHLRREGHPGRGGRPLVAL